MASKQRKARASSSEELPAEKKRRSESEADQVDDSGDAPVKRRNKERGRKKPETASEDVEELFQEPTADQESGDESPPKKGKGKKHRRDEAVEQLSPTKSRPTPPKSKSKRKENNAEDAIFERVKLPNAATLAIVNDWVKQYKNDQKGLTRDLVNFVLHAAGSPGSVSAASFEAGDIAAVIGELAADVKYKEEGGDYPLVSRAKALKRFRANYADFWGKLVLACARTWLFDGYFIEELDTWLSEISAHAATVAAMEIVSALSAVAAALTKERKVASSQYAIEKKKKNETAAQLEKQIAEIDEKISGLEKMTEGFFQSIFVHRYRDTGPDIRVASVTALARWVTIHPDHFLADNYLKYLAWTLYDRVPEVRHAALRGLLELYRECLRSTETDEEKARKKLFGDRLMGLTERFRSRMVEMAYDKDASVAATAIEVCACLAEFELLEKADVAKLVVLVTDDSEALREAVAKFVVEELKRQGGRESKTDAVRTLVSFVVEQSQIPDRPEYVVDALWATDYAPVKDWAAMAELLAEQGNQALSALEHTVLARLLSCSVRKAMGASIVPKERAEKAEKASTREASQKELTRALMKPLPELLKAFQAEADVVAELVQIVPFFPLEDFRGSRQVSLAKELLRLLREVFFLHTSAEVHAGVGRAFKALLAAESSIYSDVDVAFHELTQLLLDKLEASLAVVLKGQNDKEQDHEGHQFSLALALQRLHELLLSLKVPQGEFADALERVLEARSVKSMQKHKAASQIIGTAAKAQALLLQWSVVDLGEEVASDRRKLNAVIDRREQLLDTLKALLSSGAPEQRTEAYFVLLDLLVVFSPAMRGTTAEALAYDADGDLNTHMQEQFKTIMAQAGDDEELLELKERALLALSRGLLFNTLNDSAAALVAMQLMQESKALLDIARAFIVQWRERKAGRKDYDVFFEAIKQAYEAAPADDEDQEADASKGVQLLCNRIATSYGVAASRLRESLMRLVCALILYALQQPENVSVLAGVGALVNRLPHAEDARHVLSVMDEAAAKAGVTPDEDNAEHRPLIELRTLLSRRAQGLKGKEAAGAGAAGEEKGAKKKRKNVLKLVPVHPEEKEEEEEAAAAAASGDEAGKKRKKKADAEKSKGKGKGKRSAKKNKDEEEEEEQQEEDEEKAQESEEEQEEEEAPKKPKKGKRKANK